ncbi:MAG: tRNA (guanosine(46)-N7)-methyltransferase TrmB [Candidatus Nomurabacteria bacterium]|jgi:tRNA (guanine-N7-)-methyltransferase|nr:tRNA (guanosine(46)-N7)-methyltransferase TrmB [Candidatus Nomurabacteria bacterium]
MTNEVIETLARGDLVVMRSDTIYGIFASALDKQAVEKLHKIRKRSQENGFIVLIDSVKTAAQMVEINDTMQKKLAAIWRADSATSVILPAIGLKEKWLADTCETEPRICFRVPNDKELRKLLIKTGPLVAPSANLPSKPPASNIAEARAYFGDTIDLYIDGGKPHDTTPSRVITFDDNYDIKTIRSDGRNHPEDFVITRRRKLYKFARFDECPTCFHIDEWQKSTARTELIKSQDIVVEIGAGSALFLVELARCYPGKTFIAVDIKSDRLYQGANEAEKLGLKNIYFVRSDIAQITEVIPPNSTNEIWLTFPDPWPPKSDARHRLTAPRYLEYYKQILARPGLAKESGVLYFKTDNSPLFEWSLEQFQQNGWKVEYTTRDLHESNAPDDAKIMTSYEQRFVAEGQKINYARFITGQVEKD